MIPKTALRHTGASLTTAVLETLLFVALVHWTSVSPNVWNPVTIFLGTSGNYLLNRHWVFGKSGRAWHYEAAHFASVAAFSLAAQSVFFILLFHFCHNAVVAKLIALSLGFLINYPLKRWVFKQTSIDS